MSLGFRIVFVVVEVCSDVSVFRMLFVEKL